MAGEKEAYQANPAKGAFWIAGASAKNAFARLLNEMRRNVFGHGKEFAAPGGIRHHL
jgi:hypothetical protein